VVLGGEDVAAGPGDLSAERGQSLDQDSGLDGFGHCQSSNHQPRPRGLTHVQTPGNTGTLQGLVDSVLPADGHETGHLHLGELNLAAPEGSQGLS
jgi:hypothetical protein